MCLAGVFDFGKWIHLYSLIPQRPCLQPLWLDPKCRYNDPVPSSKYFEVFPLNDKITWFNEIEMLPSGSWPDRHWARSELEERTWNTLYLIKHSSYISLPSFVLIRWKSHVLQQLMCVASQWKALIFVNLVGIVRNFWPQIYWQLGICQDISFVSESRRGNLASNF